ALLKKLLRRSNQPQLLPRIDTRGSPSIPITRARPHFHDHERVPFPRHDIQLAQPPPEIALQDFESLSLQELDRKILGPLPHNLPVSPAPGRPTRSFRPLRMNARLFFSPFLHLQSLHTGELAQLARQTKRKNERPALADTDIGHLLEKR